jgi:hypothetical protein
MKGGPVMTAYNSLDQINNKLKSELIEAESMINRL